MYTPGRPPLYRRLISKVLPKGFHIVSDTYGKSAYKMTDVRTIEPFRTLADEARKEGRTLLYYDRLYTLYQALDNITKIPGPLRTMEVGVYKGGGSSFLASIARKMNIQIEHYAIDTFEGHSAADIPNGSEGRQVPGLFADAPYEDVSAYLSGFSNIHVIKGRIQDVASELPDDPFSLLHLDTDIYEPTRFCLERYGNQMPRGGIIVLDDYGFLTCPGIRQAVTEYIDSGAPFARFELQTGQCVLVRY